MPPFFSLHRVPLDDSYSFDAMIGKPQTTNFIVSPGTINGTISETENSGRLINAIADHPAITYDGLAELRSIPRRTVSREMKKRQETLHCIGISGLVKDHDAMFLTDIEDIEQVDPAKVRLVPDNSSFFKRSRLYIESFASLMIMLDPTAIAEPHDYKKEDIKGLCVRRFKKDIKDQVQGAFKERKVSLEKCNAAAKSPSSS